MFSKSCLRPVIFLTLFAVSLSCAAADDKAVNEAGNKSNGASSKREKNAKKKNAPKKALSETASIKLGQKLYKQYQCFDCHSLNGKGCKDGILLDGLGKKRTKAFIREHIVDPDKHFDKHPAAFTTDMNLMPPQNLEPYEIDSLVDYLHSLK